NQHPLRMGMAVQGYVGDHFMVDKFIFFAYLQGTIQDQCPTPFEGINDGQLLEGSLFRMQDAVDLPFDYISGCIGFMKPEFMHANTSMGLPGYLPGPTKNPLSLIF